MFLTVLLTLGTYVCRFWHHRLSVIMKLSVVAILAAAATTKKVVTKKVAAKKAAPKKKPATKDDAGKESVAEQAIVREEPVLEDARADAVPQLQAEDLDDAASSVFKGLSMAPSKAGGSDVYGPLNEVLNKLKRKAENSGDPSRALKLFKKGAEVEAGRIERYKKELENAEKRQKAFKEAARAELEKQPKAALVEMLLAQGGGGSDLKDLIGDDEGSDKDI